MVKVYEGTDIVKMRYTTYLYVHKFCQINIHPTIAFLRRLIWRQLVSLVSFGSEMEDYSLDRTLLRLADTLVHSMYLRVLWHRKQRVQTSKTRSGYQSATFNSKHKCGFASSKASLRLPTSTNTLQLGFVVPIIVLIAAQ